MKLGRVKAGFVQRSSALTHATHTAMQMVGESHLGPPVFTPYTWHWSWINIQCPPIKSPHTTDFSSAGDCNCHWQPSLRWPFHCSLCGTCHHIQKNHWPYMLIGSVFLFQMWLPAVGKVASHKRDISWGGNRLSWKRTWHPEQENSYVATFCGRSHLYVLVCQVNIKGLVSVMGLTGWITLTT